MYFALHFLVNFVSLGIGYLQTSGSRFKRLKHLWKNKEFNIIKICFNTCVHGLMMKKLKIVSPSVHLIFMSQMFWTKIIQD